MGYDVRPSMRRLGYGTQLLRLALPVLQEHGIRRVRITCDDDNIGSAKIIEKNGGVLSGKKSHAIVVRPCVNIGSNSTEAAPTCRCSRPLKKAAAEPAGR